MSQRSSRPDNRPGSPPQTTSARLVVNADGFGSSPAASAAILRSHRDGIVTSTSIIGNCENLHDVHRLLSEVPQLGVGVALNLFGGRPLAPAESVSSLLDRGGLFPRGWPGFLKLWGKGVSPLHLEREFDAQVRQVRAVGLPVDHLNTHGNVGFLAPVAEVVERVAQRHGIAGVRRLPEPPTLSWLAAPARSFAMAALGTLGWLSLRQSPAGARTPQSWGYVDEGSLNEVRILEIIGRLERGSHELICHPGGPATEAFGSAGRPARSAIRPPRDEEQALCSQRVKEAVRARGIVLCRWGDLG